MTNSLPVYLTLLLFYINKSIIPSQDSQYRMIVSTLICTFDENITYMQTDPSQPLPDCLSVLEPYVRRYCELQKIESELRSVFRVSPVEETATHMDIRVAAEREIRSRKDYLAEYIAMHIVDLFIMRGILSKYPELQTTRNEK